MGPGAGEWGCVQWRINGSGGAAATAVAADGGTDPARWIRVVDWLQSNVTGVGECGRVLLFVDIEEGALVAVYRDGLWWSGLMQALWL